MLSRRNGGERERAIFVISSSRNIHSPSCLPTPPSSSPRPASSRALARGLLALSGAISFISLRRVLGSRNFSRCNFCNQVTMYARNGGRWEMPGETESKSSRVGFALLLTSTMKNRAIARFEMRNRRVNVSSCARARAHGNSLSV